MSVARRLAVSAIAAAVPLAAHAGTFTTLYTFTGGADGGAPSAQLIYQNGALYGVTSPLSFTKLGNVFTLDPKTGSLTVLYNFTGGTDGNYPTDLISHGAMFYGTTTAGGGTGCHGGCGTVFSLDAKTGKETVLYSFPDPGDGNYPEPGGLIYENGVLYGVATLGGSNIEGIVFAVNPSTGVETTLFTFDGTDGAGPNPSLVFNNGLLYGTANEGGPNSCLLHNFEVGCGVVFSVDPASGAESTLYAFTNGADGYGPISNLIYHKGLLYGGSEFGGKMSCGGDGCGTLFSIDPATGVENTLNANAGKSQVINGLSDHSASIYETVSGYYDYRSVKFGELVKFDLKSGHGAVLHKFTNGADGSHPNAAFTYNGGVYYGTTTEGGDNSGCGNLGCGTIFQYTP
jgi:uncharacterized repeat protein (TIGR03803 family)